MSPENEVKSEYLYFCYDRSGTCHDHEYENHKTFEIVCNWGQTVFPKATDFELVWINQTD